MQALAVESPQAAGQLNGVLGLRRIRGDVGFLTDRAILVIAAVGYVRNWNDFEVGNEVGASVTIQLDLAQDVGWLKAYEGCFDRIHPAGSGMVGCGRVRHVGGGRIFDLRIQLNIVQLKKSLN